MIHRRVAGRYAKALFQVGLKTGKHASFAQELHALSQVLQSSDALGSFLANPTASSAHKRDIIVQIVDKTSASDEITRFLQELLKNDRLQAIPSIALVYQELLDASNRILRGTVVSALPLSSAQLKKIQDTLTGQLGHDVQLEASVDPDVLAGFRVQVEDVVLDATLSGQMNTIAQSLRQRG